MKVKVLELADRATSIPIIAINPDEVDSESERHLMGTVGFFNSNQIIVIRLCDMVSNYDPYKWSDTRTMFEAHKWLREHFSECESGDIVDVEFILGETPVSKVSDYKARESSDWVYKVSELSGRPGVNKLAVENFLISLVDSIEDNLLNLRLDSKLCHWNPQTVNAVREGIRIRYKLDESEFKYIMKKVYVL